MRRWSTRPFRAPPSTVAKRTISERSLYFLSRVARYLSRLSSSPAFSLPVSERSAAETPRRTLRSFHRCGFWFQSRLRLPVFWMR